MAPPTEIRDQILTGALPGAPNGAVSGTPGETATLSADPTQEYVAGRPNEALLSFTRSLPRYIDDLTRDLRDDLYDQMQYDYAVSAAMTVLKAGVLEDGVSFSPAKPDQQDDGHDLSVTIRAAAERMVEEIEGSFDDALWDLCDAFALGNKTAELTYRLDRTYTGRTLLVLDRIAVKPRRATAFVVDAFQRVIALKAVIPGQPGWMVADTFFVGDLAADPTLLPREKFAILTNRPKDADPRGTSDLRPAYTPWWLKQQVWADRLRALAQFGGPSLIGELPAGALPRKDSTGKIVDPATGFAQDLEAFRNGKVIVHANGAKVSPLSLPLAGDAFRHAIQDCDAAIVRGVLTQDLATREGARGNGSRAAAQVHQDVLGTLKRQRKRAVVRMVRQDILRPWVRWNWGEAAMALVPIVSLGDTEDQDAATKWTAAASLKTSGYLDDSQLTAMDTDLKLPPRDPDWLEKKQALPPPPTPVPTGLPQGTQPAAERPPEAVAA